ncbi:MAG: DUF2255 family protein [Myxococcota bacterium]|nr:DUF2255 family protein [Myxococcota bacterium]
MFRFVRTEIPIVFVSLLALAAPIAAVDWSTHADADTVVVITNDEDGSVRETTIWLLVLDGEGYIRTGNTTWAQNLERGSRLSLRIGEETLELGFSRVEDEALFERIEVGFREKYGFSDRLVGLMPGAGTRAYKLIPKAGA